MTITLKVCRVVVDFRDRVAHQACKLPGSLLMKDQKWIVSALVEFNLEISVLGKIIKHSRE